MKKEHCLLCYIASKYHQAFAIMYISLNFQSFLPLKRRRKALFLWVRRKESEKFSPLKCHLPKLLRIKDWNRFLQWRPSHDKLVPAILWES